MTSATRRKDAWESNLLPEDRALLDKLRQQRFAQLVDKCLDPATRLSFIPEAFLADRLLSMPVLNLVYESKRRRRRPDFTFECDSKKYALEVKTLCNDAETTWLGKFVKQVSRLHLRSKYGFGIHLRRQFAFAGNVSDAARCVADTLQELIQRNDIDPKRSYPVAGREDMLIWLMRLPETTPPGVYGGLMQSSRMNPPQALTRLQERLQNACEQLQDISSDYKVAAVAGLAWKIDHTAFLTTLYGENSYTQIGNLYFGKFIEFEDLESVFGSLDAVIGMMPTGRGGIAQHFACYAFVNRQMETVVHFLESLCRPWSS